MTLSLFVITCLAAYRLTRVITQDHVTEGARSWLTQRIHSEQLDYFVTCSWCAGLYVSGAVVAAVDYFGSVPLPGLVWLAVSCVVGLTGKVDD